MSSVCVCHTDEYCFYCEIYSLLEHKNNEQTQAIERVIAELELKKTEEEGKVEEFIIKGNKWLAVGKAYGLEIAINQLKEVLATETNNTRISTGDERDT